MSGNTPGNRNGCSTSPHRGRGRMTTAHDASGSATPVRRPPVRCSTMVRSGVAHTFNVFVRTIGTWWPAQPFSAGGERVRDVTIERFVGGRIYETWDDGSCVEWGQVLTWQPPTRFAMTWNGTPRVTEVELTFNQLGQNLTRVTVEHRGWERLTDEQLSEDCALPGGYNSGAYASGWKRILAALAHAAAMNLEERRANGN
jgi:hypothetical protein